MTDRYAIVGNPVAQAKSPQIHAEFARQLGHDLQYLRLEAPVTPGGFAATVDAFRAQGGRGVNVTAPFKLDAVAYATEASDAARLAGAANALTFDGARVRADNFDGVGLVNDLLRNQRFELAGRRLLILGAGGAARGALLPLLQQRPAEIVIANRTAARALALAHECGAGAVRGCGLDELGGSAFDLVFNATSASLSDELPAVPAAVFAGARLAYEMAYGRGLTPFLRLARDAGVPRLADGLGMLLEQAAEVFNWWRGVRPDTAALRRQWAVPLV
ncbi:shikimate dehydrogenase [Azohydromonas caseinilytica]|uniref:Shikimate dehydrogenase (NADP(+)) n=1 Tax=Azohydromonas caseinilytica TaxID=2728836 RepID=A0A848F6I6_9BURK|nr:shikimate dehydrogenase [Azohydromonas caseinilytica]NML15707.1 shikimate dehydrogenase [Azohydromonas caseinilytica]